MNRPYTQHLAVNDNLHLKTAYWHIREALDELNQVYTKDKNISRILRDLYTMEDTMYQYAIPSRREKK